MTKELDYSGVTMIGNGYAKRDDKGVLGEVFPTAVQAAGGDAPKPPKLKPAKPKPKSEITGDDKLDAANARADKAEAALRDIDSADLDTVKAERDSALRELEAANAVIAQLERELKAAYESDDDIVDVFKVVDGVQADNASWHNITRAVAIENTAKNPDTVYNIVLDQG